jgi:asparagine synthase (glutamine-hydrolysing)
MLAAQRHRGPDSEQLVALSDHVVFGHNRLAIIDLTDSANQPFFSSDSRFCLVFNGEIYNYTELKTRLEPHYNFRTHSDTEVLLAAYMQWGVACLDELIGMFAFAIYDKQKEEVFMARDRFGVKPFYYAFDKEGTFYFASEIKTLHTAGIPKIKNESVWAAFLIKGSYGYKNETFWSGIFKLEAGHYIKSGIGQLSEETESTLWYDFVKIIKTFWKIAFV